MHQGKKIKRSIFCTNRDTAALERDARKNTATQNHRIDVDFWDGERLRVALDTICKDIRQTYLGIAYVSIQKVKTFTPPSSNEAFVFSQLSKNIENATMKARRYNLAPARRDDLFASPGLQLGRNRS